VTAPRTLALAVLVALAAAGSLHAQAPATVEPAPAVAEPSAAVPPVAAEPTAEEREFAALLGDLQRYSTLAGEELRRELAAQTQALNRTRSDFTRVRVAMLHTLSRQGTTDDQRALQLLDAVVKGNPGPVALRQLAAVLATQVAERVRVVREEQARSEAALQKLEALRAMERSLLRDRLRSGGGGGSGSGGN
jgi:hypothetical protein